MRAPEVFEVSGKPVADAAQSTPILHPSYLGHDNATIGQSYAALFSGIDTHVTSQQLALGA